MQKKQAKEPSCLQFGRFSESPKLVKGHEHLQFGARSQSTKYAKKALVFLTMLEVLEDAQSDKHHEHLTILGSQNPQNRRKTYVCFRVY